MPRSWHAPAYATAGVAVILASWYLVAELGFHSTGAVPGPLAVLGRLVGDVGEPRIWTAFAATGREAALGYVGGNAVALLLAGVVVLVPWWEALAGQLAVITSCIPLTAVAPLIVLLSGSGSRTAAVVLAGMSVFYTTVVGTLVGLRSADRTALDLVAVYGGGRWTALRKVRLATALPAVLSALRIGVPAAFVGAILGEFFLNGVDTGVGIALQAAQIRFSPLPLWSLALLSAAVAGVAFGAATVVVRAAAPWAQGQ